jgi:hypothetical protein
MSFGATTEQSHNANLPLLTEVNDVAFTDYHLFRAESRILTGADVTNEAPPAPPK